MYRNSYNTAHDTLEYQFVWIAKTTNGSLETQSWHETSAEQGKQ